MTTAWEEYKKNLGDSRPWHLLNKDNYVEDSVQLNRYSICLECPELINTTKQCKKCGCFMNQKTKLKMASCPIGKW
jgi:hypothetical protein